MVGEQRRIIARGRRGTLVLSCARQVTDEEYDEIARRMRRAVNARPGVLVLEGGFTVDGVIGAEPPHRWRGRGHRPRWAR